MSYNFSMNKSVLSKESFLNFLKERNLIEEGDFDNVYEVYSLVIDAIYEVLAVSNNPFDLYVNHFVIIIYIINEYKFYLSLKNIEKVDGKHQLSEEQIHFIGSLCADKYLTNEKLNYKSESFANRFNPPISTLNLYLNFSLRILENSVSLKSRNDILIKNMLVKALKMGKCILNLLIEGFETEAFSTWRTLHENECIIFCLVKNGTEIFTEYFKHIKYSLAYRGQIKSKEATDKIFEEIKEEMKKHDLKSKDMKKFIEYGYLYVSKEAQNSDVPIKLNFRDGVERVAGLSNYSKVYEMASEIAHSSPLLLFSRREYYFNVTLLNLYETFFRLEIIFEAIFKSLNNDALINQYERLKQVYLGELRSIYQIVKQNFIASNTKLNKSEDAK